MDTIQLGNPSKECYYPGFSEKNAIPNDFYSEFTFNNVTYAVKNFAIIDDENKRGIAKILCIFATKRKEVQLVVRKFIFTKNLSTLLEGNLITFNEESEVVEDFTKDYIVAANKVIKKCFVIYGQENDNIELIQKSFVDPSIYFFCRYIFKSKLLFPVLSTQPMVLIENNFKSPIKSYSPHKCIVENKATNLGKSPKNLHKNVKTSTPDNSLCSPLQRNSVRRNLNESFGVSPGDITNSVLNYSIVTDEDIDNPLKLKLKISENNKKPYVLLDKLSDICVRRKEHNEHVEMTPTRRSTRNIQRKSYADYISPLKSTPKKRSNLCNEENFKSPKKSKNLDDELVFEKRVRRIKTRLEEEPQYSPSSARRSLRLISSDNSKSENTPESVKKIKRKNSSASDAESNVILQKTPQKKINLDESIRKSVLKIKINKLSLEENASVLISSEIEDNDIDIKNSPKTPRCKSRKNYSDSSGLKTPKTNKATQKQTPRSSIKQTPSIKNRAKLIRDGIITPSMQSRSGVVMNDHTPLMKARSQLHVSYVPSALPCREKEYCDIYNFLESKLRDGCGGCIYVSGVPGTGKTATVTSVISNLQKSDDIRNFNYVSINGMRLTEPRQSYVEILKQLTGKTVPWEQAQSMLEEKFTKSKKMPPTIMLIDELDILCTKRQDVVYNLLDWPTKAKNQLIVITIANTMDLPERLLMSRVTSRLGLTRLTFQAYTHKQLMEIVTKRLSGTECFNPDAIQLVARKVASVSGDARRALDICRRAAEIAESENNNQLVSMNHVNDALNAMITQPKVRAIKHCSKLEKLLLQSLVAEVERTGVEETTFLDVFKMLISCAAIDGFKMVSVTNALAAISRLSACKLILSDPKCNDISQKLILNVSADDVYYALKKD